MSTGAGIFWATILILVVIGLRYITKSRRWRLVGAIVGGLIALGLAIGMGIYFYYQYENRPTAQKGLFGIELNMSPVEVKLVLGEPLSEDNRKNSHDEEVLSYLYRTYEWSTIDRYVRFKNEFGAWDVYMICDLDPGGELFNMYTFTPEEEVLEKLGQPTNESISDDGLRKFLTFASFHVAVEFEKKVVTSVCVTNDADVSYINEYDESNHL
jgi:hypothetical protein